MIITIFVHGTFFNITKLPLTYKLFYTPEGFHAVKNISSSFVIKSKAQLLENLDAQQFQFDHFYSYGWPGSLNDKVRKQSSFLLYKKIKALIKHYEQNYKVKPLIRVIGHSHGGNVALYLAEHAQKDVTFFIDELILLGCPVQHHTAHLTKSSRFKQIYSFHSHIDLLQVLDPQGLPFFKDTIQQLLTLNNSDSSKSIHQNSKFFSERHFPHSDNILQINIKINKLPLFHLDFILIKFFKVLPQALTLLKQHQTAPFLPIIKNDIMLNIDSV